MIIYVKTALQTEVLNCLLNKTFMFSREDKTRGVQLGLIRCC